MAVARPVQGAVAQCSTSDDVVEVQRSPARASPNPRLPLTQEERR
jgi:hypothetical protein